MENLTNSQIFNILFIIVASLVFSIMFIRRNYKVGLWLVTFGIIVTGFGLVPSFLIKQENVIDIILLNDTAGLGRAYVVGCIIFLSAILIKLWEILTEKRGEKGT